MEIKIGTRRSDLARWQANHVADLIRKVNPDAKIKITFVSSVGDRDRRSDFQSIGGMGVFTQESELVLLRKEADLIVHSLKDLTTTLQTGLILASVPKREDPRDVLCGVKLNELKDGLVVGTGSIRRRAQLLSICSGLIIKDIRGNVPPRLRKVKNKEGIDATILAAAGLTRLNISPEISETMNPDIFPYAVGQGALGIETREEDHQLIEILHKIEDPKSRAEVDAERSLLKYLEAGCSLPIGVNAKWVGDYLVLDAQVTDPSGNYNIKGTYKGLFNNAEEIGVQLGKILESDGAKEILDKCNKPLSR